MPDADTSRRSPATTQPATAEPMRILQIETFGRGGLTHYAYNLSLALAARGHHVTLVTAACYELDDRTDTPENVEIVPCISRLGHRLGKRLPGPLGGLLRKGEAVFDSLAVANLARRLRPDVIHLHCTNQIALAYLSALQRLPCPVVATAHVVTPHEPIRFQDAIYGRIHRLGQLIIAHSEFDRQRLRREFGVADERLTVIPHGEYGFFESGGEVVDRQAARDGLGLRPDDEVVLFFGYIREYKGLDILYESWPKVAADRPAARLLVAGDPVQLPAARRDQLQRWGDDLEAVQHFGYIPFAEVSRYFAAADVLVMPYRHISQSGVLFLALSLGVPVVATRVGALPEMLQDGDSALLVAPEAPDELARALVKVLADDPLRQRLSGGAKEVAAAHAWPAIAGRTEAAFHRLVTAHRDLS